MIFAMKKDLLLGVGTVVICTVIKEVAKITWNNYKEKVAEHNEVIEDSSRD